MIFLSNFIPQIKFDDLKLNMKVYPANAGNRQQWSILDGFKRNKIQKIDIINSLPIGAWPIQYRKVYVSNNHSRFTMEGYCELETLNIPVLKQLSRYFGVVSKLKKNCDPDVLIYTCYLPYLMAATKKRLKKTTTLIVTDLPQYYDLEKTSIIRRVMRKIISKLSYHYMSKIDKFVLLTEQMNGPLQVGSRPYIVMEGIAPPDYMCQSSENHSFAVSEHSNKETLLYSGSLSSANGVRDLVDAFFQLKQDDLELWICGSGEDEQFVKEVAAKDGRIKFFGFLSAEETINLQRQATILVNPRKGNERYTEYSFPSKTMEYMLSGRPVIMYKLPGIPDEYDRYVYYVNKNESLFDCIQRILKMSEKSRNEHGKRAKEFVVANKNSEVQIAKIIRLMGLATFTSRRDVESD